jgi:hypothetical protein
MAINYVDIIKKQVYDLCSMNYSDFVLEDESAAYAACSFILEGRKVISRTAKITPTKSGQFVTFWKRNSKNITEPYSIIDVFNFLIINVVLGDNFGQFIFPKSVLISKGILSTTLKDGKRGFRVYAPWDIVTSKQALKTQQWQCEYFLEIPLNSSMDKSRAERLYNFKAIKN